MNSNQQQQHQHQQQLYPQVVLPALVHPLIYFNPESQQQQQMQQQLDPAPSARLQLPPASVSTTSSTTPSTCSSSSLTSSSPTTHLSAPPPPPPLLRHPLHYTTTKPHYLPNTYQQHQPLSPTTGTAFASVPAMAMASQPQFEQCKWQDCNECFSTPQDLYSHLCDVHVGRKAKNNLALKCQWDQCKVQVVKRDHITSHLRVHVALKPYPCLSCHKKFKRPQDLKKHQKVHSTSPPPSSTLPTMLAKRPYDHEGFEAGKRAKYSLPPLESILNTPNSWPLPPTSRFQLRNNQQAPTEDLEALFESLSLGAYDPSLLEEGEVVDTPLYPLIAI